MINEDIRKQIDYNNQIIDSLLQPDVFILDETVKKLLKENEILRQCCKHNFINGVCEYCDSLEK